MALVGCLAAAFYGSIDLSATGQSRPCVFLDLRTTIVRAISNVGYGTSGNCHVDSERGKPGAAIPISDRYLNLVRECPLRVIRSESEYDLAIAMLDRLSELGRTRYV